MRGDIFTYEYQNHSKEQIHIDMVFKHMGSTHAPPYVPFVNMVKTMGDKSLMEICQKFSTCVVWDR